MHDSYLDTALEGVDMTATFDNGSSNGPSPPQVSAFETLYRRPLQSRRTGPYYNAFSYPTKIDPEIIALFIAVHTRPGDTVLDVFSGSGTTGIATRLCDCPTPRMRELVDAHGLEAVWGPRRAVLYELSTMGALLSRVMSSPPDAAEFSSAARRLLAEAEDEMGWIYDARAPDGSEGRIRYTIWSEVLLYPCCGHRSTLWDAAAEVNPARLRNDVECPNCGSYVSVSDCSRGVVTRTDPVAGDIVTQRERIPVRVYGRSGSATWSRAANEDDLRLIGTVETLPARRVPTGEIFWGDLHRAGYHTGISKYHQLYTSRNLVAMSHIWARIGSQPAHLQDALRTWVLSFNGSHATLLTRIVAKKNMRDFVVSGAQSGVLYISGLPVEKNVIEGVRRKVKVFADAFALTAKSRSEVRVVNSSSTTLDLQDNSVDYIFTDPPFGDFIPYAEVNQVNEAWLDRTTDRTEEAIISRAQRKGVDQYASLLSKIFGEAARVLRPGGCATVVFHASKPQTWQAVGNAFAENGFAIERTSVLDKVQVSFKQVVSEGGTRGDALFLLRSSSMAESSVDSLDSDVRRTVLDLVHAAQDDPHEMEAKRLYSRYVANRLESRQPVELSAPSFYQLIAELRNSPHDSDTCSTSAR